MVALLAEPLYARSIWGQKLTESLISQLKCKRIPFNQAVCMEDIPEECRYLFVIGTDHEWVGSVLKVASHRGIYPILISNEGSQRFDCRYSTVWFGCDELHARSCSVALFEKLSSCWVIRR